MFQLIHNLRGKPYELKQTTHVHKEKPHVPIISQKNHETQTVPYEKQYIISGKSQNELIHIIHDLKQTTHVLIKKPK